MWDLTVQWPSSWYTNLNLSWSEVLNLDLEVAVALRTRLNEQREEQAQNLKR